MRKYRERLLKDGYRPAYHFASPDGNAFPGDPNGAFFADGIYHIMYLYQNEDTGGCHWGHLTTRDLLHYREMPDALKVHDGDGGAYSGGAFADDDKTVYLSFWQIPPDYRFGKNSIAVAYSKPPYEDWTRMEDAALVGDEWGIKDIEINGETVHIGCADPSNIWKKNGFYYMQLGNLHVLNKYGREESSPEKYRGGWTELLRSKDLKKWEYVGRFYDKPNLPDMPDDTEDDMCPSFLPLFDAKSGGKFTGKYLQIFISHNKGCQYFIGELKGEKFIPEAHGRFTWTDSAFFAPEALVDDKNRHIMWNWLRDDPENAYEKYGWCGVFSVPRVLWLEDGALHMAPCEELDSLEYNVKNVDALTSPHVPVNNGEAFRIKARWKDCDKCGFAVRIDENTGERTEIYVDKKAKKLVMNTKNSGCDGWKVIEEAPFEADGDVNMDIFVDKSVIEVYAGEKQAICRRVYPTNPKNAVGVEAIGDLENLKNLQICDMFPANLY